MHLFYDFLGPKMKSVILKQACGDFFKKKWEPVINISWLKNEQVKVCFFTFESPYSYFCCNLRHTVMPFMYSEMQIKLSKTRESPLESMGQFTVPWMRAIWAYQRQGHPITLFVY